MKKPLLTMLGLLALSFSSMSSIGVANAGSNNGYTTAANVYSGSSSQTWYGGGVEHTLALWRMEADTPAKEEATVESTDAISSDAAPMEAPAAPTMEAKPEVSPPAPSAEAQPVTTEAVPASPTAPTMEAQPEASPPAPSAETQPAATEAIPSSPTAPTAPTITE